ncbi:MAG: GNAT family N-acetyltransferase [Pseudomonadota bacterium]
MTTVRLSKPDDFDAVDALLRRVYPKLLKEDYAPSVRVLVLPRISRAQPALLASGSYYVAELNGEIVGAGGWTLDRRDHRVGHIRHLVTSDRHLRRGIGTALIAESLDHATRVGVRRMICWSTFTAVPFYASQGFRRLREIVVPLDRAVSFPAVEMERGL